jgi:hypothetical protein
LACGTVAFDHDPLTLLGKQRRGVCYI